MALGIGVAAVEDFARGPVLDQGGVLLGVGQAGGHEAAVPAPVVALGIGGNGSDCQGRRDKRDNPHKRAESGHGPVKHRLPQRELMTPPHLRS